MTTPLIEAIATIVEDRTGCCDGTATARAALTAITEAGYAVVPVEPTEAMIDHGKLVAVAWKRVSDDGHVEPINAASDVYHAMISAAQGDGA